MVFLMLLRSNSHVLLLSRSFVGRRTARVFVVVAPFCSCPASLVSRKFFAVGPGCAKCFFYSFPCLSPGAQQKKHTLGGVFFFFCSAPVPARGFSFPCLSPGGSKKNTLGGVFFLLRARTGAHSLTAGLGGDVFLSPGWCFFFAAAPPGPGWCFFFLLWPCPDAHSLTHSLWAGAISARPGWCFFVLLRPRRVF